MSNTVRVPEYVSNEGCYIRIEYQTDPNSINTPIVTDTYIDLDDVREYMKSGKFETTYEYIGLAQGPYKVDEIRRLSCSCGELKGKDIWERDEILVPLEELDNLYEDIGTRFWEETDTWGRKVELFTALEFLGTMIEDGYE